MSSRRLLLVALLGLASASSPDTSSSTFRVRKQQWSLGQDHRREQDFDFDLEKITFSKEGQPMSVPAFELQLFPTAPTLSDESELALEVALEDFLRWELEKSFPVIDDDKRLDDYRMRGEDPPPQFTSAEVRILSLRTITGSLRQRRRTQARNLQSSSQQTGQEVEVEATLRFLDGTFPSGDELNDAMEEALFGDFDTFLKDFLPVYETSDLAAVQTGNYFSGFTAAPTAAPIKKPTKPPKGPGGSISQANEEESSNLNQDNRIDGIYPAIIAGVGVFLCTTLLLAYRRKADEYDSYSRGTSAKEFEDEFQIDHVSIDYDGREEARQLEIERQMAQMADLAQMAPTKEDESSNGSSASQVSSFCGYSVPSLPPPSRTRSSRFPKQNQDAGRNSSAGRKQDPPLVGTLKSEKMADGYTTVHVPSVIERSNSGWSSKSGRSRRYESTPNIIATASSADSAYYENEMDGSNPYSNNYNDEQRGLPSMLGGSEFGMGNIITRGLV